MKRTYQTQAQFRVSVLFLHLQTSEEGYEVLSAFGEFGHAGGTLRRPPLLFRPGQATELLLDLANVAHNALALQVALLLEAFEGVALFGLLKAKKHERRLMLVWRSSLPTHINIHG